MNSLLRAIEAFFDHLSAIEWHYVAIALVFHVGKMAARARSWRNILAAAYPHSVVRWRSVFGAYASGVAVNAVVPARGGDVLKLYIVKTRISGATYSTLVATLAVETFFDFVVSSLLLVWALQQGVLPGLDVLPRLPDIDWLWVLEEPAAAAVAVAVALLAGFAGGVWAARRVDELRERVGRGFAIARPPSRYLRQVVPWQSVDWACRIAAVYFFLLAFGIGANLHNALLVQVTNSLSTILPLTPAGIGTEQALLVYVLAGTASAAVVISFSVGMKLVLIAANVAIGSGAVALMLRTLRWRRVVAADRVPGA